MAFKKITALVRCTLLDTVEHRLQEAGVRGLTITHVRGYGEHANLYREDWTVRHARIEIFLDEADVDRIVTVIKAAACTGIVAVPVERFEHIREAEPETAGATWTE